MSVIQTFFVSFGILFVVACLIIAVCMFVRVWFGVGRRMQAKMRDAFGVECEPLGLMRSITLGIQLFFIITIGIVFLIAAGLWELSIGSLCRAWYWIRGKPLPTPDYDFHN